MCEVPLPVAWRQMSVWNLQTDAGILKENLKLHKFVLYKGFCQYENANHEWGS